MIAYLHGFASSPLANKGLAFARRFDALIPSQRLLLPDLNAPSFAQLTLSASLDALDRMHEQAGRPSWRLIGSSMGGYLAALWAARHPGVVERAVLLCPGFEMATRWPQTLGPDATARWEAQGHLTFPDGAGTPTPVSWDLILDARRHPPTPEIGCPTLILHGLRDETVPIDVSRQYAAPRPHVRLVEVDADHRLADALDRVLDEGVAFLTAT